MFYENQTKGPNWIHFLKNLFSITIFTLLTNLFIVNTLFNLLILKNENKLITMKCVHIVSHFTRVIPESTCTPLFLDVVTVMLL